MPSIKDIAIELGVSTTTVSLVLSGKHHNGRVSKVTVDKVQECARRLNYHPNMIAKSLKSGSSKSVGLIVADITNAYFSRLVFVIQNNLQKLGYTTLIMNTNESVDQMGNNITMLQNRQVDGFIIVPTAGGEKYIKNLMAQNYPLVLLDRYYTGIDSCNVMSDNYGALYNCVNKLVESGKKRVCFVSIENNMIQVSERLRGYREAMQSHGLFDEKDIFLVDYNAPEAQMAVAIDQIFSAKERYDTIIFAINRLSTIGAKMIIKRGIVIGEDIQIVYFDSNKTFDLLPNKLPHIVQQTQQLGDTATELLLEQLNTASTFVAKTYLLPCCLNNFCTFVPQ